LRSKRVSILRHPYPYRCAFTICNDCDYYTREAFECIHEFLNTNKNTRIGKGLGLPIADSMFMYSGRPGGLSYFKGTSLRAGENAELLIDAAKEGWIDSMHSYGDFPSPGTFSRPMAENAIEELDRRGLKIRVWIDHGSGDNRQNLNVLPGFSTADDPDHPAYHTDLLKAYGIRFVAGYNSDRIGQDGGGYFRAKGMRQEGIPLSKIKWFYGKWYGKKLLRARRLKDKSRFFFFCRARNGVIRPDARFLSWQLNKENINNLVRSGGTMLLYQHLGASRRRPNIFPFLDREAVRALNRIAEMYQDQVIWVAPTSRILGYALVRKSLDPRIHEMEDEIVLELVPGNRSSYVPEIGELRDLSLRLPYLNIKKMRIRYKDYEFNEDEWEVFQDGETIVKINPGPRAVSNHEFKGPGVTPAFHPRV